MICHKVVIIADLPGTETIRKKYCIHSIHHTFIYFVEKGSESI